MTPPFSWRLDQSVPCPRDPWGASFNADPSVSRAGWPLSLESCDPDVQQVLSGVKAHVQAQLNILNAPSAAVHITHGGATLMEVYVGTSRLDKPTPVTGDSGYRIASNTKIFTSVMLFQLRDRGLLPPLGIDSPVSALLPGFVEPRPPPGFKSARPITLRSLAMHTSGLQREAPFGETEADILAAIGKSTLLFPPYATTAYSNLGIGLLGRALEKIVNTTWEEWVLDEIMRPLGMMRSGTAYTDSVREFMVDGVDPQTHKKQALPSPKDHDFTAPAGQAYSTPNDMAKWINFLMGNGGDDESKVLDFGTRLEMLNTGFMQADGISAIGQGTFEMAFIDGRWSNNKLGCIEGYRSAITMVPSLGIGIFGAAASTCDNWGDGDAVTFPIVHKLIPPLTTQLKRMSNEKMGAEIPLTYEDFVGSYCDNSVNISLVKVNGTSQLYYDANYPFVMRYEGVETEPASTTGKATLFRLLMRGDYLSPDVPGCEPPQNKNNNNFIKNNDNTPNLCPVSCNLEMARGDLGIARVYVDRIKKVATLEVPNDLMTCYRN